MIRVKIILLIVSVAASTSLWGSDDWTGLWRVTRYHDGKVDGVIQLYLSGDIGSKERLSLYAGSDLRPVGLRDFKLEDRKLSVRHDQSVKQPLPMTLEVARDGEILTGQWTFRHPQLRAPLAGEVKGFRVHSLAGWDPWKGERGFREKGWNDVYGHLLSLVPFSSSEEFLKCWQGLEADYYFMFQHWMYGRNQGSADQREKILIETFAVLKDVVAVENLIRAFPSIARDSFAKRDAWVKDEGVVHLLSTFGPEPIDDVILWSRPPDPEEEASCSCTLDLSELFVTVNPTLYSKHGEWGRVLLRQAVLRKLLWKPQPKKPVEILRDGLALRLALKAESMELLTPENSKLRQFLSEVSQESGEVILVEPQLPEVWEQRPRLVLGYSFAEKLLETNSIEEMVLLEDVSGQWLEFTKTISPE